MRATYPHAARIVSGDEEVVAAVVEHVKDGWARKEGAVLIATPEHAQAVLEQLARDGISRDRVLVADARATLDAILDGRDMPSPQHFEAVVGALLDEARRRFGRRPPRAFGEMVDLLVHEGRVDAAVALEELWCSLGRRRRFSLLCTYRLDLFDPAAQTEVLPEVCRLHAHVAAGDERRLDRAVDEALRDVLGAVDASLVRSVAAAHSLRARVGQGQVALMWVSRNMPFGAPRILAAARARYAA